MWASYRFWLPVWAAHRRDYRLHPRMEAPSPECQIIDMVDWSSLDGGQRLKSKPPQQRTGYLLL